MDSTWTAHGQLRTVPGLLDSRLRLKKYFAFFSIAKPDIVILIVVRYIPD
jgi:hypothetical protein